MANLGVTLKVGTITAKYNTLVQSLTRWTRQSATMVLSPKQPLPSHSDGHNPTQGRCPLWNLGIK